MQCARPEELGYDFDPRVADKVNVCERPPERLGEADVFINALPSMSECDRHHAMASLETPERADNCYVYCAQRSCHAAVNYMNEHAEELADKCAAVTYLRNGALGMPAIDLVGGDACHAKVISHNKESDATCLTCEGGTQKVGLTINGIEDTSAVYSVTDDDPPDWFARSNVWSNVPPQFSDARYHNPPVPHHPAGSLKLRLDTSTLPLDKDAVLAYWASEDDGRVREAHAAYGNFANSGIVQCRKNVCEFSLNPPGRYTADGQVFRPHLHFSEWKGDRWSSTTKTIQFSG